MDVMQSAARNTKAAEPPDWNALRSEFPATERYAYLDMGKMGLLPSAVRVAVDSWLSDSFYNVGGRIYTPENIGETREEVAAAFGAPVSNIALVRNMSAGVSILAGNFPWREGDNIVLSALEKQSDLFPWRFFAPLGLEVRWAEPDDEGRVTVDSYASVITEKTRVIALSYVAGGNGYRSDLPAISQLCKGKGIRLVVDAVEGIGVLAAPVASLGADVLCAAGHKAQFSVAGAGLMYLSDEIMDELDLPKSHAFPFSSNDAAVSKIDTPRLASQFEFNEPFFLGSWIQKRSAGFIASVGLEHIEARIRDLTTELIERLEVAGFRVLTPKKWEERAGLVCIAVEGDPSRIANAMGADKVIVSENFGTLRAGVHFYNNQSDIERFVDSLSRHHDVS